MKNGLRFFFFSSRRRHTRSDRDWSSDVCSSDLHLGRREAGGVDAGELRLEVVRLVDDQETAPPESLGVPVAERGEVGGVGAEDRRPEGGRLGADVRALAERAARPAAGAARGRDVRAGIAVARVVVAALHDLELGAELALVLILDQLLRVQQLGVTAPPRERHRDVALAHARRPLDEDHARGRRVVQGLRDRIGDGGEQTRLLGTRVTPAGKGARRSSASVLPSSWVSRRIGPWAYGGEADAAGAAVLGGRAGRRRTGPGADRPRPRSR